MYLILAIAALLVAPPLWALSRGRPNLRAGLDALTLTALAGLLLLTVVPHALLEGGWAVLPVLAAGLVLPGLAERRFHRVEARLHGLILALAAGAVILHAAADGLALGLAGNGHAAWDSLAAGVILHRLPMGLAMWWLIRPAFGRRAAWAVLIALGLVTGAGAMMAGAVQALSAPALAYFEAAMVGMLLHVMVHPIADHAHHALPAPLTNSWAARLGTLGGLALVAALSLVHGPGAEIQAIWLTAATVAPLLLVACGLAVALDSRRARFASQPAPVLPSLDRVAPWLLVALMMLSVLPVEEGGAPRGLPAGPTVHWLALALLLGALVTSLLHQGVRRFLAHLMPLGVHDHDHHRPDGGNGCSRKA